MNTPTTGYYIRNIEFRLAMLRGLFALLTSGSFFFYITERNDAAYITTVAFLFCAFIKTTRVVINKESLQIKRYYFFGIIPTTFRFRKRKILRFDLIRGTEGLPYQPTETLLDIPILLFLFPFLKLKVLAIQFQRINCARRKIDEHINLDENEFRLIAENFLPKQ